jgi:hydroxymethylpyrimidine/phosphomethylpyrimidine kinase
LLKGGHLPGDALTDLLVQQDGGSYRFEGTRLHSTATHGTGCTLASAIATGLALGQPLNYAVEEARRYVRHAIESAPGFGHGHGPLDHGWPLRRG